MNTELKTTIELTVDYDNRGAAKRGELAKLVKKLARSKAGREELRETAYSYHNGNLTGHDIDGTELDKVERETYFKCREVLRVTLTQQTNYRFSFTKGNKKKGTEPTCKITEKAAPKETDEKPVESAAAVESVKADPVKSNQVALTETETRDGKPRQEHISSPSEGIAALIQAYGVQGVIDAIADNDQLKSELLLVISQRAKAMKPGDNIVSTH